MNPSQNSPRDSLAIVLFAVPPSLLNRRQVDEGFRRAGFHPVFVHSERELGEVAGQLDASLLFLDLLFDADPISLISRLKRRGRTSIVVLAEHLSPNEESALKRHGASDCLRRPVHAAKLLQKAAELMQRAPFAPTPATSPDFPDLKHVEAWVESCTKVARKVEDHVPGDTAFWPAPSVFNDPEAGVGYADLVVNAQKVLQLSNRLLRAGRCTLFSLRPHALWPAQDCPSSVRVLASSEPLSHSSISSALPTALFPQIVLAFRRREALFIPQSIPSHVGGLARPRELMLKGQVERVSAVLPLFDGKRLFSAVLCQFESFDPGRWMFLEQTMSFFRKASQGFAQMEFMNRIYAQRP